jgi:hypothetical protein
LGRVQQSLDALVREDEGLGWGRDDDKIDLRGNQEAGFPSLEEADVLGVR